MLCCNRCGYGYRSAKSYEAIKRFHTQDLRLYADLRCAKDRAGNGNTNIDFALCAGIDSEIIAVAGASVAFGDILEVGVDVKKEWRGQGLAGLLVRNLTVELLERDMIPFYSVSVTNLASQAVAITSGYMPFWTDSYGVR